MFQHFTASENNLHQEEFDEPVDLRSGNTQDFASTQNVYPTPSQNLQPSTSQNVRSTQGKQFNSRYFDQIE